MSETSKADAALDRGAERLRDVSERLEERGGVAAKLAEPLAEDADFLPKLKPSLVKERFERDPTGSGSSYESPDEKPRRVLARAGNGAADGKTSAKKLLPLVGGAFAAGVVLAKIVDWRGHAHPRD